MPEPAAPRTHCPLTCNEIDALAEHLNTADPGARHIPNETVARLLATLDGARKDLKVAFAAWNDEADGAHRKSMDWRVRAGRAEYERNRARAELDRLRRLLGEWWTQWTTGRRVADSIIWDDPPPWSEEEARDYVAGERGGGDEGVVVGARIVGDWYDAEAGPRNDLTGEEMAALVAEFKAAAKDGDREYAILPSDLFATGGFVEGPHPGGAPPLPVHICTFPTPVGDASAVTITIDPSPLDPEEIRDRVAEFLRGWK